MTVLCEFPNHPGGEIPESYRGKLIERDALDGVDVLRTWVLATPKKSSLRRLLFYASFMLSATLAGLFCLRERVDVVFASSPPLPAAVAGLFLSVVKRVPLIFEVRDPWPQAAIELGELESSWARSFARRLESMCYARAAQVITVSTVWKKEIVARRDLRAPVALVRNGARLDLFTPRPERARELRRDLRLDGRFVVLYLGLHGLMYRIDTILTAAAKLRADPRFAFLLVGEGPKKEDLVELAASLELENVIFHEPVPRNDAPTLFSVSDVSVVPLPDLPYSRGCVPLKLYESWACGCPTVVAALGEARELVESTRAGIAVDPGDGLALSWVLSRLADDPQGRSEMAGRGLAAARECYDRAEQARTVVELVEAVHERAQP